MTATRVVVVVSLCLTLVTDNGSGLELEVTGFLAHLEVDRSHYGRL